MSTALECYREYLPAKVLRPLIRCFWSSTTSAVAAPVDRRVLPDGCIDFIFDISSGSSCAGMVVGTMTRHLLFQTRGAVHLVAVRFQPGGAAPFLGISAAELTDTKCELPADWRAERLAERLGSLQTVIGRIRLLESAFLRRLADVPPVHVGIQTAVSWIGQRQTVEVTARKLGMSRQHLTRLFRRHVGIGPKVFARVDRFQRLLSHLKGIGSPNWCSLGLNAGYYDQAHMINECRSLAGVTPVELCDR